MPLSTVSSHPYLGINLDTKLTWANHITDIASKSSTVLTLGPCKPDVTETAYNMLVRPKLEYAFPIWNPHTITSGVVRGGAGGHAPNPVKNVHGMERRTSNWLPLS